MLKRIFVILYILFYWSSFAYASLEIREVMYNPEGSDTNREWIEVYNNGNSVDIENWYFFENNTYHGLYPEGFSNLSNGERALIVKDISSIKSILGSQYKYIKASFSLNNTGETITISDENKVEIDSYTYSSDAGGNGDGDSLQLIGSQWTHANPTPGEINSFNINNNQDNTSNNNVASNKGEENISNPYYVPNILLPSTIIAQTDFNFSAEIMYVKGGKEIRELDGYYFINFGDGNSFESDRRISMNYRYRNSGNYILVFEYYSSKFAFDHGDEPDALLKKNIKVIGHDIEITRIDLLDGITLKNKTSSIIDLSSWKIVWSGNTYIFPRYSYVNSGDSINILFSTLGFSPKVSYSNRVQLLSNAGELITSFPVTVTKKTTHYTQKAINNNLSNKTISSKKENTLNSTNSDVDFFTRNNSYLDQYLSNNPNKVKVNFGEENLFTASVYDVSNSKNTNNSIYYALGSLLLILGVARFTKSKNNNSINVENDENNLGTIEIIE